MAIGVLVALRRCTEAEAFEEIVRAVHATGVGLGSIAQALVALASGAGEPFPYRQEATDAWGDLLAAATVTDHHG